ncbi:MAG: HAMP domain-containing histidine kinase [Eubacterium sp.]|nr:HAMP domain-containing histidine kinase [Eubacterium sp.]
MNKKLLSFAIIYTLIMIVLGGVVISHITSEKKSEEVNSSESTSVEINEIKNLIKTGDEDAALQKCDEIILHSDEDISDNTSGGFFLMWILVAVNILGVLLVLLYVNSRILRPFEKMKGFASEIAKGNLDVGLKVERGNYFGDFTWAFENMRKEIIKSRNTEKTAIENNKTVIATLSHDIKTPMASIRAYVEAFEANMDSTPEKRQKYLSILTQKCDEVSKLTNDLFVHSISEMNRLEVREESMDIISFLDKDVRGLFAYDDEVDITFPVAVNPDEDTIMVTADPKRLLQIVENLKSNSEKYAKTRISISLEVLDETEEEAGVRLHFRDYGPGIAEEEIPFITGKFYRGRNSGKEDGSGLGLYIVNELVNKMNGKMNIYNKNPGLDVVIDIAY